MMRTNRTWHQLEVGETASLQRVCTANDLLLFAHVSGNLNALHLPTEAPHESVAPSMWVGALASAVLGTRLPGPGTLYRSQTLDFYGRVHVGETLKISVTVLSKLEAPVVKFSTRVERVDGTLIAEGIAEVDAPMQVVEFEDPDLPDVVVERHQHFDRLLRAAKTCPPLRTVVVCPESEDAMQGMDLAIREGLILPIAVGNENTIRTLAEKLEVDLRGIRIVHEEETRNAAATAVRLVNEGAAEAVMKGHLHSDELLAQVVKKDGGLRGTRRLSHVFVMDCPGLDQALFISDAAINIAPDLVTKVDITQNAIDVARACGLNTPKVGILSAVETVNPAMPSTLDAAILSKMAERGQIKGGLVDGPLAMDNAIDLEAAKTKGITSMVAGRANVLIAPNIEAGNMLAKELTFIAHAEAAGIVVGAKVPIMLTSRADDERARLVSCAVALLLAHWNKTGVSAVDALPAVAAIPSRIESDHP